MAIDAEEQIGKFQKLIEQSYQRQLHENLSKKLDYLIIDFLELTKLEPILARQLLDSPQETIKALELALNDFGVTNEISLQIKNLPESSIISIKDIQMKYYGPLVAIKGKIRILEELKTFHKFIKFECPSCGSTITVPQDFSKKMMTPFICCCGRKHNFKEISSKILDSRVIFLEDITTPKGSLLKATLLKELASKNLNKGDDIILNGILDIPFKEKEEGKFIKANMEVYGLEILSSENNIPKKLTQKSISERFQIYENRKNFSLEFEMFKELLSRKRKNLWQINDLLKSAKEQGLKEELVIDFIEALFLSSKILLINSTTIEINLPESKKEIHHSQDLEKLNHLILKLTENGQNSLSIEELKLHLVEIELSTDKIDECLDSLKHNGDIFEPKKGFIQVI